LSTRAISAKARGLSGTRLSTPLLVMTPTEASGSGMSSALPSSGSTFRAPIASMFRLVIPARTPEAFTPFARPAARSS
jgi:hypothetical protein